MIVDKLTYSLCCIMLLMACPSCTGMPEGGVPMEDRLRAHGLCVTLAIHPKEMTYTVSVQNISDRPCLVFDDLTEQAGSQRFFAGPAKVAIKDENCNLMSVTPYSPDGWLTSAVVSSQATVLPAKLRSLAPQEEIIGTFRLSDLCTMACPADIDFSHWIRGRCIRLKYEVRHTDPMLAQSFVVITAWRLL